jgi:methyl-accepting chemotaxis protein
MDLEESVQKHAAWKVKFRVAIDKQEEMDSGTISVDNYCELGQWLHGPGRASVGSIPEFGRAVDAHKAFHLEAGKVAQLVSAKKFVEAENAIGPATPYATCSVNVATALMALKKAAKL